MRKRSRRYITTAEKVDENKKYGLAEGVAILKECDTTKFDQTVEIAMKLGIDPKQSDQMVRGSVSLPKGTGKTLRVIAFCQGGDVELATKAGAIEAGADELVERVQKGWLDFDVAVATPEMMPKVGRLGRVLGPKGLMPSPKSGTVSQDVATAVGEFAAGKIEFRNDSGGNVHAQMGKLSFPAEDLVENVEAFMAKIRSMRPSSAKGAFVRRAVLSSTMGPGVEIDIT
jgi:large subunit ribosomal protein L1